MGASIKDAFGEKFDTELKLNNSKKAPRLKLEGVIKQQIIEAVKANMKPETPQLHYPMNGQVYHVILAETAEEMNIRQMKYGFSLSWINWKNQRISLMANEEEELTAIQSSTPYIFVGVMKTSPKQTGGVWYNFRLDGVITMDEVVMVSSKEDEELK